MRRGIRDLARTTAAAATIMFCTFAACDDGVSPDTTPPIVAIVAPADGATVTSSTAIRADATDNDRVRDVAFFVDGQVLATDATAPYEVQWEPAFWADGGIHSLHARATDQSANVGLSEVLNVTVEKSENATVQLISPEDGASVRFGDVFTLAWEALAGAETYTVQVAPDDLFSTISFDTTTENVEAQVCPLDFGRYYWRVRATHETGAATRWSRVRLLAYGRSFNSTFGPGVARDVEITPDGGFIIAGWNYASNLVVVRTDADGDTLWTYTSTSSGDDYGHAVVVDPNGGFVIAGERSLPPFAALVLRIDDDGDVVWERTFLAGGYAAGAKGIIATADGGYAVVGTANTPVGGDLWLLKMNSVGEEEWQRSFDLCDQDNGRSLCLADEDGYAIAGVSCGGDGAGRRLVVVRVDGDGREMWCSVYGTSYETGNAIVSNGAGGFVCAGQIADAEVGGWLVGIDGSGELLWQRTLAGGVAGIMYDVDRTADGGFVVTGFTSTGGSERRQIYLEKTDPAGVEEWHRLLGGDGDDVGYAVKADEDLGFVVAGWNDSDRLLRLLKTSPTGELIDEETGAR